MRRNRWISNCLKRSINKVIKKKGIRNNPFFKAYIHTNTHIKKKETEMSEEAILTQQEIVESITTMTDSFQMIENIVKRALEKLKKDEEVDVQQLQFLLEPFGSIAEIIQSVSKNFAADSLLDTTQFIVLILDECNKGDKRDGKKERETSSI